MSKSILYIAALLFAFPTMAQQRVKREAIPGEKPNKIFNFEFHYTYVGTTGDFSNRFNSMNAIGGGLLVKTTHNFLYGVEGSYYFGANIKETNMLLNMTNNVGELTTNSGEPGSINLSLRGLNGLGKVGYLFPVSRNNKNSGIVIMLGGGIVMHRYNINVKNNNVPQLTADKIKGYDRYSSGWATKQFVGYYHQSHNKLVNFYVGADLMQAITYNRRKYNYDEMQSDVGAHRDQYWGVRFGWMIPVYINTKTNDDEYIYK